MSISVLSAASVPGLAMRPSGGIAAGEQAMSPGQDFASMLGRVAGEAAGALRQGEAAAIAGMQGGLPLQSVVEQVMAAERTLLAAIAVRDKTVSAYLEITRMQI